jgi:hypothetical protein
MAAAAPAQTSSWVTIHDFKPGIHQNLSPLYPPGTAALTNTYRCYALPSGTLAPLPITHTQSFTLPDPIDPATMQNVEFRIVGLHVIGPLYWPDNRTVGTDQNNTEIFIAVEWWVGDEQTLAVYKYKRHHSTPTPWQLIWQSNENQDSNNGWDPDVRPAGFHFGTSRSNHNDPKQSGPTVVGWAGAGFARYYPDDANPNAESVMLFPGDKDDPNNINDFCSPDILVMHQGRCIIFPLQILFFGVDSVLVHNEAMYWTAYNDFRAMDQYIVEVLGNQGFWNAPFGAESPVGWGCVASLSANELFLLKRKGGAYICMGDVSGIGPNSPNIRQLPFVKSPGFALNNGTVTPVGYAYPVDNGTVWLWAGGDFATEVAPQLPYNFWRPEPKLLDGTPTRWGYQWTQSDSANNFTLMPNNWVWETTTNSWWRIDDPNAETIYRWSVDWRYKKAYGAPRGFRGGASGDPTVLEFDTATPASSYSWQSQPISTTLDKSVNVLNMGVVAAGEGRITLTVTTRQDHVGRSRSFTFTDPDYIEFQVESCGVRGTHLTFHLTAESFTPGAPAPLIHEIRYEVGATVPQGRPALAT